MERNRFTGRFNTGVRFTIHGSDSQYKGSGFDPQMEGHKRPLQLKKYSYFSKMKKINITVILFLFNTIF